MTTEQTFVDELIASGVEQRSRKYRLVARIPVGMTAVQALEKYEPEELERLKLRAIQYLENQAHSYYLSQLAHKNGDEFELTVAEFNEFLVKTKNKKPWSPKGPACSECKSLGHMHSKDCSNNDRRKSDQNHT